ncbi:MAG TPA: O-antigen ligase family protein [Pyrinomonadaceae bacterium]|nr:O-antigen ligase family protein [Pyrinomonadaceae bacterium]
MHRSPPTPAARWLERGLVVCLFLFALAAPHSIAAAQTAWLLAMLLWAGRLALLRPRPALRRTPVDYALLGFFILTFFSALLSYDPYVSIGKLRAASLFTIVYVVAQNVSSGRVLRALALVLVASCAVNVVYTFGAFAVGRGIKIEGLRSDSALYAAGVRAGDTILEVDGRRVEDSEMLAGWLSARASGAPEHARVRVYRLESYPVFEVKNGRNFDGDTPETRLGITRSSAGRDERAHGFYGHYVTYAEVLQLVASLALGLFVALRGKRSVRGALLALAVAGLLGALALTVTRAAWLGFLLSAFAVVFTGASRRTLLVLAAVAVPLALVGLFVLQQKRQVGFIDPKEGSTAWRLMVYRESFDLLVSRPRHMLVGVGMDSIKRHYREWGLFDKGRQNTGHLHSTPLQLAVERGLPTLFLWLALVFIYGRMLWRLARTPGVVVDWVERGVVLGALGGLVGFVASGMVHYNLGDSEVVMIFYFIMGLALVVERRAREGVGGETV